MTNKCPKCKADLEITREETSNKEIKVTSATDERHGYFGETSAEYGASDRDMYHRLIEITEKEKCNSCGYVNVSTINKVSETYCKD